MSRFLAACLGFVCTATLIPTLGRAQEASSPETVKVFILAGQSNMEGKAPNALWEHQASQESTASLFAHLRADGEWVVRQDAFIRYGNRHGGLTLGYGSPDRTGVELELGTVLADHFAEPVLLIKTAWGGHSLFKQFRPPSAGMPADAILEQELEQAVKRVATRNEKDGRDDPLPTMEDIRSEYGASYRRMLDEVRQTTARFEELFPDLQGKTLEIAGFVWFQGWNDQYGGAEAEYANNLRHLIRDLRTDLKSPNLPAVIGVMGQNGSKPATGAMKVIQEAQLGIAADDEFRGSVRSVATDRLVDQAAENLYPEWKDRFEEWQKTGGDHPYHYLGSAIWFQRIGHAMGESLLELMGQPDPPQRGSTRSPAQAAVDRRWTDPD